MPISNATRSRRYEATQTSNTALAANTAQTVIAPASNTAGAWIIAAHGYGANSTSIARLALVAKGSAPTSPEDGDVLAGTSATSAMTGAFSTVAKLEEPIFVAAGKGVYWVSSVAEVGGGRSCLYRLES